MRNCDGLSDRLDTMQSKDIEAVIFEIYIGSLLFQKGYPTKFVKPSGKKGHDYDYEIQVDGVWVAVEVKTRRKGPLKDHTTLRNALSEARGQLPINKPTMIAVSIAPQFEGSTFGTHAFEEIKDEVYKFLMGTTRVNTVLIVWDSWEGTPSVRKTMVYEATACNVCNVKPRRFSLPRKYLIENFDIQASINGQNHGFPSYAPENRLDE
jgi:hypothetical protein